MTEPIRPVVTSCADEVQAWFEHHPHGTAGISDGQTETLDPHHCPVCGDHGHILELARVGGHLLVTTAPRPAT